MSYEHPNTSLTPRAAAASEQITQRKQRKRKVEPRQDEPRHAKRRVEDTLKDKKTQDSWKTIRSTVENIQCARLSVSTGVQILRLRRKLSSQSVRQTVEGEAPKDEDFDFLVLDDTDCYDDDTGHLLFKFRKRAIYPHNIALAKSIFSDIDEKMKDSKTRGSAAGKFVDKSKFADKKIERIEASQSKGKGFIVKNGKRLRNPVSNPVKSYKSGMYFDRFKQQNLDWGFSKLFPDEWKRSMPFFSNIAEKFESILPGIFKKMKMRRITTAPEAQISPSVPLSTVSINVNFATAYHQDRGDFKSGFSTLTVVKLGEIEGGHLVFPEYKIAIKVDEGDLLLNQSHRLWHGNTPIVQGPNGGKRISFVTYLKHALERAGEMEAYNTGVKTTASTIEKIHVETDMQQMDTEVPLTEVLQVSNPKEPFLMRSVVNIGKRGWI
jgi:hypothetical protein